jgi:membrane protease YdiL (CAAX protease family)
MDQPSNSHDMKTALLLSGAYGLAAAAAVPALLPSLPTDARTLPLPLRVFCLLLAVQMTLLYGALAFFGLRLARRRGLSPAPLLSAAGTGEPRAPFARPLMIAGAAGLACGAVLIAAVATIQHFVPGTLPQTLHPPSLPSALAASLAGSLGEEILCRLFVLSALVRMFPPGRTGTWVGLAVSSLLFGALHAPAFVLLFGGLQAVPPAAWVWLIGLNGLMGMVFGWTFLRRGVEAAIVAHFATDLVWHVASQLFSG